MSVFFCTVIKYSKTASRRKIIFCGSEDKICNEWDGMAADSQSRKLKDYIINSKHKVRGAKGKGGEAVNSQNLSQWRTSSEKHNSS